MSWLEEAERAAGVKPPPAASRADFPVESPEERAGAMKRSAETLAYEKTQPGGEAPAAEPGAMPATLTVGKGGGGWLDQAEAAAVSQTGDVRPTAAPDQTPTDAELSAAPKAAIITPRRGRGGAAAAESVAGPLVGPERPPADWTGEKGVLTNAPAGMVASGKNAVANLQRAFAEEETLNRQTAILSPTGPGGSTTRQAALAGRARERNQAALAEATRAGEEARVWAEQTKKEVALVTPEHMDTLQQGVWSFIQSAPPTALGLAVGIATKNPAIAMTIAGGGGSAMQAGGTYGEAMDAGAPHRISAVSATIQGAIEMMDSIPIGIALKPGSAFLTRITHTMGAEAGTEAAQQFLQDLQAFAAYNPDMTLGEMWQNVKVASIAGALGGAVYGTAGHLAEGTKRDQAARELNAIVEGAQFNPEASRRQAVAALDPNRGAVAPEDTLRQPGDVGPSAPVRGAPPPPEEVAAGITLPTTSELPPGQQGALRVQPADEPAVRGTATRIPEPDGRVEPTLGGAPPASAGPEQALSRPQIGPGNSAQTGPQPAAPEESIQSANRPSDAAPFIPTHTLEGVPVVQAQVSGEFIPGEWIDAQGNGYQEDSAKPIVDPTPNAEWDLNGVRYKVEVTGPGQEKGTARLADGQEIQVNQLAKLDDTAKELLGLMPPAPKSAEPAKPAPPKKPAEPRGSGVAGPAAAPSPRSAPVSAGPEEEQLGPYQSEKAAKSAAKRIRKAGGQKHTVVPYRGKPGKFSIEPVAEKPPSPAQVAARLIAAARARRRIRIKRTPNPEQDTLIEWIQKSGGITNVERMDITGDDKINPRINGSQFLFTKRGYVMDDLVRMAREEGYLSAQQASDALDNGTEALKELIRDELRGVKRYSERRVIDEVEAELEGRFQEAAELGIEGAEKMNLEQLKAALDAHYKAIEEAEALAGDVPLDYDVTIDEADDGPGDPVENLVIADLGAQLFALDEGAYERLSEQYGEATPAEFIEALKKALKERTDGKAADRPARAEAAQADASANAVPESPGEGNRSGEAEAAEGDDAAPRGEAEDRDAEGPAGDGREAGPEGNRLEQRRGRYANRQPPQPPPVTIAEIHAFADSLGIKWDDDPAFMAWTKERVGKARLDEMDQAELASVYDGIDQLRADEELGKVFQMKAPGLELSIQTEAELKAKADAEAKAAAEKAKAEAAAERPKKVTVDQDDMFNGNRSLFQTGGKYDVSGIMVKLTVTEAETGRPVQIEERADLALAEVDGKITLARSLLECLRS